jgi:hypothetical protein
VVLERALTIAIDGVGRFDVVQAPGLTKERTYDNDNGTTYNNIWQFSLAISSACNAESFATLLRGKRAIGSRDERPCHTAGATGAWDAIPRKLSECVRLH